jgi:hypothetical protein
MFIVHKPANGRVQPLAERKRSESAATRSSPATEGSQVQRSASVAASRVERGEAVRCTPVLGRVERRHYLVRAHLALLEHPAEKCKHFAVEELGPLKRREVAHSG